MKWRCFNFDVYAITCVALGTVLISTASASDSEESSSRVTKANKLGPSVPAEEIGMASYYGVKYHGRPTASGEMFDMNDLTAAHPRLPFGTRVKVTHLANHRSVIVRINDRGPFVPGRVLDLSQAAATELRMIQSGLARVKIQVVE